MGDGWETKRRRGPGHDWIVVRLGARGTISRIEVDTDHFKGNAPESCAVDIRDGEDAEWTELLPRTAVEPHSQHRLNVRAPGPATHARLAIYPDGGIARLRLFGTVAG
jgi:allantoicase